SENLGNFLLLKTKFILYMHHWMSLVKDNNVPLEIVDQLLVLKPKDKDLLLLKSLYYCMVHKYKEVKQLITNEIDINTLKKSPRFDTEAYFILAFSYVARGKFEKALEIANLVLTLFPDHPISFLTKALVLGYNLIYRFTLKEPNIDTFLELIKLTVSFEPISYEKTKYLLFQAHILNGLGKYDEAIESIENAMEMVPTLTSLIIVKIYYIITSKREDEALKLIDQHLESHPNLKRSLYLQQSYIYVFQKKYEKGLEAVNKALEIDPENTHIINNKAILLANLGRKEEAIETSEKLINLSPNYGNSYDTYGEVLMTLGEYKNALEKLEKALSLEPTGWFAFATCLKMGKCYKQLGKYEKALEYFVKGKKIAEKMHPSEREEPLETAEKLITEIKTLLGEQKNSQ
ncbi:MAG: tetratricopeptide repeat protein, partial [Promethearchaeota archaeon]